MDFNLLNMLRRLSRHDWQQYLRSAADIDVCLTIVGAQKGGTTALFNYLGAHPDLTLPSIKEIDYFNSLANQPASTRDYWQWFPKVYGKTSPPKSIDVSPNYLLDAAHVAPKIKALNPTTKIVIVLREPVSRAVSAWFMYKKYFIENPDWFINARWVKRSTQAKLEIVRRDASFGKSFAHDIQVELETLKLGKRIEYPIVEYGHYTTQIADFKRSFAANEILFLESKELKQNTQNCLDKITKFANIKSYTLNEKQLSKHFVGDNKKPVDEQELKTLTEYYLNYNDGLADLIGGQPSWERLASSA